MARQVRSPVYWQEIVTNLTEAGIEAMIEIGPGKTLSGLVKKINHEMLTMHVEDCESLSKTIEILKEHSCQK